MKNKNSWIISANSKYYDHKSSFKKNGFIDWKQRANYNINDIVYVYSSKPDQKIIFKCIVEKINMNHLEIIDDKEFWKIKVQPTDNQKYFRIRIISTNNSDSLSLNKLLENGLKSAPQGPLKIKDKNLLKYISSFFIPNNINFEISNNDESLLEYEFKEGTMIYKHITSYERNISARNKAIVFHGCCCKVCNFNFKEVYGDIGEGFIEVHHIIPISSIKKNYKINPKKDLIPLCSNCHRIIHRYMKKNIKFDWKTLKINK